MRNQVQFGLIMGFFFLICVMLFTITVEAQKCNPSGRVKGTQAPKDKCDPSVDDCCKANKFYTVFKCSPPVSGHTKAILTINDFEKGGDGGGPSECDNKFHSNKIPVVALSTGWFNGRKRCHRNITIFGNGRSTKAMVVDECDSTKGCDDDHGFQPPCRNHIVDASQAVWEALKVPKDNWGEMDIFWADDN
ncbi:OLC1v1029683C1 [Oldenlandia corymbosa var. corymbosa]|uniref:OLC1v1029683C1 n=1 Tax=Oldenlandia corymbosa var. corymbosa TaxID=529605 RepID=A0AAV1CEC4_OLDCO|nr:OLC1v1029683C1 [Oldenlandia corymbosa var. corymbosa]